MAPAGEANDPDALPLDLAAEGAVDEPAFEVVAESRALVAVAVVDGWFGSAEI